MEGFHKKRRVNSEEESDFRAWNDLCPDALGLIFKSLSLREVLQVIPRVCKPWCRVVEGPYCWERIDIEEWSLRYASRPEKHNRMLRMLVTRGSALLRQLKVSCINDDQMLFIAEHGGSLQTLMLTRSSISDSIMEQAATKLTSLTTLDISYCYEIGTRALESIGTNCKSLASLTWNMHRTYAPEFDEPPR